MRHCLFLYKSINHFNQHQLFHTGRAYIIPRNSLNEVFKEIDYFYKTNKKQRYLYRVAHWVVKYRLTIPFEKLV